VPERVAFTNQPVSDAYLRFLAARLNTRQHVCTAKHNDYSRHSFSAAPTGRHWPSESAIAGHLHRRSLTGFGYLFPERKSCICHHLQSVLRPSADTSLVVAPPTPTSTTSSSPLGFSFSHRRRRSSAANPPQGLNVQASNESNSPSRGVTSLAPIPGMFYLHVCHHTGSTQFRKSSS
jgi:hypothetical protein